MHFGKAHNKRLKLTDWLVSTKPPRFPGEKQLLTKKRNMKKQTKPRMAVNAQMMRVTKLKYIARLALLHQKVLVNIAQMKKITC